MSPRFGKPAGAENEPEKETDAADVEETTEKVDGDVSVSDDGEDTVDEPSDESAGAADVEETAEKVDGDASVSDDGEDIDDVDAESADDDKSDAEDYPDEDVEPATPQRVFSVSRLVAFGVLPGVVLLLAGAGAYVKWQSASLRAAQISSVESLTAAKDGTVAMLSYKPDSVDKDLGAARDRLTGAFKDSYIQLTQDVVIPGAKQKHISATATVPAAASVSATASHAVALVFVNQTVVVDKDPPSASASSVRVTLDKVGQRWLISGFDPV